MGQGIELPQELDGVDVLAAAVAVRNPLPFLARIIEVEHRGDGVDAQAVDMELAQPVERVGEQEVADLVAAVVEDQRAPVAMFSLPGIGMLVERGAVESRQRVCVLRKMSGDPVEK